MPGLQPKERDGQGGRRDATAHPAAIAIEARGHVNGDHGHAAHSQGLDRGARHPVEIATQPGAEQRVDDHVGTVQAGGRQRRHRTAPCRCCTAGGTAWIRHQSEGGDADIATACRQETRGNIPVSAVVAGAAQDILLWLL